MIARNAPAITAVAAVLTFLILAMVPAVGGLCWLIQLNGKVDYLHAELEDTQHEIQVVRQEVKDTRWELLAAFERSEQRMLDALSGHTHNEQGEAIFTGPVSANTSPPN